MKKIDKKLKNLRSQLKEIYVENERLYKEKNLLERKLDLALDKLKDISAGFYPSTYEDKWSHSSKLQLSAASTLKLIGVKK